MTTIATTVGVVVRECRERVVELVEACVATEAKVVAFPLVEADVMDAVAGRTTCTSTSSSALSSSPSWAWSSSSSSSSSALSLASSLAASPPPSRDLSDVLASHAPWASSHAILSMPTWCAHAVACIAPRTLHLDAPHARTRAFHERWLIEQIEWAMHLGVPAVLLPDVAAHTACADNYARCLHDALTAHSATHATQFWLPIRAHSYGEADSPSTAIASSSTAATSSFSTHDANDYSAYLHIKQSCHHHKRLRLAVLLSGDADLPSVEHVKRLQGEPLGALLIDVRCFVTNRAGYPVLPRAHQRIVRSFASFHVPVLLYDAPIAWDAPAAAASSSSPSSPPSTILSPSTLYLDYLQHLLRPVDGTIADAATSATAAAAPTTADLFPLNIADAPCDPFEAPYRDTLQSPLQPLRDNLESQVYAIFERDPVKYAQYEEAILLAVQDHVRRATPAATAASPPATIAITILVVGAGRGPLVRCALRAVQRASDATAPIAIDARVIAVEKNKHAVQTLRSVWRDEPEWQRLVTIVHHDMRTWQPAVEQHADILVSELLGSFGDNELSPECIDAAERFLKPTGISIPCSSTSYVHPISNSSLWADVHAFDQLRMMETPFVVKLHNFYPLAPPQPCFTFVHGTERGRREEWRAERHRRYARGNLRYDPAAAVTTPPSLGELDGEDEDDGVGKSNERMVRLRFHCSRETIVTGLAGYFHSQLYQHVHISIYPPTYSHGMFSWFPIFFPLRTPLYAPAHSCIDATLWRCVTDTRVWYEWQASTVIETNVRGGSNGGNGGSGGDDPRPTPVVVLARSPLHNPHGRSASIDL